MRVLWLQDIHLNERFVLQQIAQSVTQDLCIFLCEARERYVWQAFHKQKITFHLATQRHFHRSLVEKGYRVHLIKGETFVQCLQRFLGEIATSATQIDWQIVLPTDYWWRITIKHAVDTVLLSHCSINSPNINWLEEDFLFLVPRSSWAQILPAHKKWKMEPVYEKLRRQFSVLMDDDIPAGGSWNFDHMNRKPANERAVFVEPLYFLPDDITQEVMHEVAVHFANHPGILTNFHWPVTAKDAEELLDHFIENRLPDFGAYQDAMLCGQPYMSHSLLSASINVGFIEPIRAIEKAEQAYREHRVQLSCAEGFIRQVLGWREYIRGVYLSAGEEYGKRNHFSCTRPLPDLYWGGSTHMNCLRTVVTELLQNGYSHHIQRLMVLCNFATLAGIRPYEVNNWFNQMYVDSQDWVVTPNVIGMGLHADGGRMATKPYVSSAQYIKKMSNYCKTCEYRPEQRTGQNACPFNALYWQFIARNKDTLKKNHRMQMMIATWNKFSLDEQAAIHAQALDSLEKLENGQL